MSRVSFGRGGVRRVIREVTLCALLTLAGAAGTAGIGIGTAHAAVGPELTRLPAPVVAALRRHRLGADRLSVYVQPLDGERPLLAFNADVARQPASTIKTLTTAAALDLLGPTYSWKTEAYLHGTLRDGTLNGDLLLKGYGDPFLTTEQWWTLLRGLRQRGLRTIAGRLLIDDSYFAPDTSTPGEFDAQPNRAYNALPTALMLNFQALEIGFLPEPETGRVRVVVDPPAANLRIDNRLMFVAGGCAQRRLGLTVTALDDGARLTVSGRYPGSCGEHRLYRLLLSPEQQVHGVFQSLWRDLGGEFDGGFARAAPEGAARRGAPFHTLRSRPLAELIRGINKFSNNVMTRQLLLTLGAERYGAPGTELKGQRALRDWLASHRLDFPELVLDNGSGLSRATRISARHLGQVLRAAARGPYAPEFLASLPLAALDGTLQRRFRGEPLAGKARLKTGSLGNVEAIAGYLTDRAGRRYIVVMLHNQPGVNKGSGDAVQNALLRWLYAR